MLVPRAYIVPISETIYKMDCFCRTDLKSGSIVSERDYVSIFLNYIRHPLGVSSANTFAYAQTLPANLEQKYGCDGVIVFKYTDRYKVGLFEAKVIKRYWDSAVGKPRTSRFQRQLDKQMTINPAIAIWEMLINRDDMGFTLDPWGSTCVKLDTARTYIKSRPLWSFNDLNNLLFESFTSNRSVPINYSQIIKEILQCDFGGIIEYDSKGITFSEKNNKVKLPLIRGEVTTEDSHAIARFLKEMKIYSYTHINLEDYVNPVQSGIIDSILKQYK